MSHAAVKPYFANLDALRFMAAIAVICTHCWMHIDTQALQIHWITTFKHYAELGVLGVNFFFVLSGFLICYLLLYEIQATGTFNIKRYFIRRVLRIWPLFFLMLFIGFVFIPLFKTGVMHQIYIETAKPLWYIVFANNFHDLLYRQPVSPTLGSLWTIAVEEQFYILFPLILLFTKKLKILFPVLIISLSLVFRSLYIADSKVIYYHTLSVIGDFGVGGLLAFFTFYKPALFYKLTKAPPAAIILLYILLFTCLAFYYTFFKNNFSLICERVIWAMFFAAIIFEQEYCTHSLFKLGTSALLTFGGKISYGMYCFQYFTIIPVFMVLSYYHIYNLTPVFLILHPLLTLAGVYVLSTLSFRFYESYFLRLKSKFYPV